MNVGIVGHEAAKFTPQTEALAREVIRYLLSPPGTWLVSGHCHLGGIDIWAEEEAKGLGRESMIFAPKSLTWNNGPNGALGFKSSNELIAWNSQIVHCLVVRELPDSFVGLEHAGCYHCKGRIGPHVKSGGCWTAWQCPVHQWWIL